MHIVTAQINNSPPYTFEPLVNRVDYGLFTCPRVMRVDRVSACVLLGDGVSVVGP